MNNIERILVEAGVIAACLLTTIVAVKCASDDVKEAREDAQNASDEAEELRAMLERANAENARTREFMAKYDEAMTRAHIAIEEAMVKANERMEQIKSIDSGWLNESVPDGVCDMFADYTHSDGDSFDTASELASGAMCEATDIRD